MKKLSIITVCYNEPNVEKTCKSIINQTWQDFEWIVIDNNSNEQTQQIWNKYKDRIDKFISEPDEGIYDAYNKGILNANGEYLHFLNAGDCYYSADTLENIFKNSQYESKILYGDTVYTYNDNSKEEEIIRNAKQIDKKYFESNNIQTSSTFIKKELFEEFGLFNLKYKIAADTEKLILFNQNNVQFEYLPYIISFFDRSGISNNPKTIELCYKEYYEILDKFFPNRDKGKKPAKKLKKWYHNIFSLVNEYIDNEKYKIITVFGIRFEKKYANYVAYYRKNPNLQIGKNSHILPNTKFRYDLKTNNKITIGENSMINCNFIFESTQGEIEIGDRCFINEETDLISRSKIKIGNDVTIGSACTIYDHNSHSLDWRERQKDLFQALEDHKNCECDILNKNWNSVKSRPITIEDKVWLGFGCTILNGVTIGEGAIIGAKSVVRENVEPWTVVAGNPARVIKRVKHD